MDEGLQDGDGAGGVAAGDGDFLRAFDGFILLGGEFREAVDPVVFGAVGGGGVEDADAGAFGGFHDFPRGVIGQAQEHEVRVLGVFHDGGDVFPFFVGEGEELNVGAGNQALVKSKAGGPRFSNNKDFRQCVRSHCISSSLISLWGSPRRWLP